MVHLIDTVERYEVFDAFCDFLAIYDITGLDMMAEWCNIVYPITGLDRDRYKYYR